MNVSSRRPNIILINCDDLGYGDLGCYGSVKNKTPAVDRLAAEGTRFTDFYMASAVCSPSRCAMMTGCYPPRIDCGEFNGKPVLFPGYDCGLNPGEETVGKLLQDQGYATALVGKWHCGDQPEFLPKNHGFDYYFGLPYSNDMGMMYVRPEGKVPLPLMRGDEVVQEQPDQTCLTERYVEECTRFIRENKERPFFLYFAHMHVHLPHLVSERFLKSSDNGPYGAAVECIDWATAALLHELDRLELADDTIVIFTSDNGSRGERSGEGGSNGPLRGAKAQTFEGGIRVPCIVRWPGRVAAGATSSALFSAIDLLPTLASAAGACLPHKPIDGVDFLPLLRGENETCPRESFVYYWKNNLSAIRCGKWKLHFRYGGLGDNSEMRELYDLEADIGETDNRYDAEPDVVRELSVIAGRYRGELGDAAHGIRGAAIRPKGQVANAVTLTEYDPNHPYMIAMYDGTAG